MIDFLRGIVNEGRVSGELGEAAFMPWFVARVSRQSVPTPDGAGEIGMATCITGNTPYPTEAQAWEAAAVEEVEFAEFINPDEQRTVREVRVVEAIDAHAAMRKVQGGMP